MSRNDDDVEYLPIPLDRETIQRLAKLARETGDPAGKLAAALLRDVLLDDEEAHRPLN